MTADHLTGRGLTHLLDQTEVPLLTRADNRSMIYDRQIRSAADCGNPHKAMMRGWAWLMSEVRKVERKRPFDAELTEMELAGVLGSLAIQVPDLHPWRPSARDKRPSIYDLIRAYEKGLSSGLGA